MSHHDHLFMYDRRDKNTNHTQTVQLNIYQTCDAKWNVLQDNDKYIY